MVPQITSSSSSYRVYVSDRSHPPPPCVHVSTGRASCPLLSCMRVPRFYGTLHTTTPTTHPPRTRPHLMQQSRFRSRSLRDSGASARRHISPIGSPTPRQADPLPPRLAARMAESRPSTLQTDFGTAARGRHWPAHITPARSAEWLVGCRRRRKWEGREDGRFVPGIRIP